MPGLARIVALLTIGVIAALAPLAYADPPDSSWIDGIWDDDDYDGVVVMVLNASGIVGVSLASCGPVWSTVASVPPLAVRAGPAPIDDTAAPRAPPQSLSSLLHDLQL